LRQSVPDYITVKDNSGNNVRLDKVLKFCNNSGPAGVLYYSTVNSSGNNLYSNGILYWLDNLQYKQALQLSFPETELNTVTRIIETIIPAPLNK
jgi:hypothetical protein